MVKLERGWKSYSWIRRTVIADFMECIDHVNACNNMVVALQKVGWNWQLQGSELMAVKTIPYAKFLFPIHTEKPELFKQFSAESIMVEEGNEYRL